MNHFIRKTRLPLKFGLIGKPVEHSLSPLMMNTVFNELKINAIYVAFEVDESQFQDAIKGLSALKFSGFNVTIPYKEKIIEFCDSIGKKASIVNAVNTVKIIDGECLKCYNTDGDGVVATFKRRGIDTKGMETLIIGAGGAAKSLIIAFDMLGIKKIFILNRTKTRALMLAKLLQSRIDAKIVILDGEIENIIEEVDIIANATPVGMYPNIHECPLPETFILKDHIVFDVVYNPIETKLLKLARKKGAVAVSGVDMLVYQGAAAVRIWLNVDPPIEKMRKVVINKLRGWYNQS